MDCLVFVSQSETPGPARPGINTGVPANVAITMMSLIVI